MPLWFAIVYDPLLNGLIWIYLTLAGQNMGVAVIIMTVALRFILTPLSIVSEKNQLKRRHLEVEEKKLAQIYKNDPVAQHEELRKLMKKSRISPWARFLTLIAQATLFFVLYQVFVHGVNNAEIHKHLYPSISYTGRLNTLFLGFDISMSHNLWWSTAVGLYVFFQRSVKGFCVESLGKNPTCIFCFFFRYR